MKEIWRLPKLSTTYKGSDVSNLTQSQIIKPTDEIKIIPHWEVIKEAHAKVLERIMWIWKKYPKRSLLSIGVSSYPKNREVSYFSIPGIIKRSSIHPQIKLELQIIYRSNHPYNCFRMEYILQYFMQKGIWSYYFGQRMNNQRILRPLKKDVKIRPSFVYVQFSDRQATFGHVQSDVEEEEDDEMVKIDESCNDD